MGKAQGCRRYGDSMNLSGVPINWVNKSLNTSWDALSSNLKCPFDAVASLDYNTHIVLNFIMWLALFLDIRYKIQIRSGISKERAKKNDKLIVIMMAVYNTIFLLNQFLLIPLFNYMRVLY